MERLLFLIIDLLLFRKLLELLAINQSLSEGRIIFVPRLLKFSHVLCVYFPTVELDNMIWLATFPGCQGFCGIVQIGHDSYIVSFNIRQGLKCQHVALTVNLTMWLLCSNCVLPWVATTFRGKMWQRFGCILISRYVTPAAPSPRHKALWWIFQQNL